jgi:hypothetical protein
MNRANMALSRSVLVALALYAVASFLHHVHNAAFLSAYPNLPQGLSTLGVYAAWALVTSIGVAGYLLWRTGYQALGLLVLGVYGMCGLDGLAHYFIAEFSAHTASMHFTILFEVVAGLALIVVCARTARKLPRFDVRV